MATTTNYGWTTPDDTALVKDGASAIRSLGTSVDTTTKNLNPSTTLGDIEYRSSTANTNTRLGIGTTGQVLAVSGGVPAWTTLAGGGGMTLLSTTTLSGASTEISSISGSYKDLLIEAYNITNDGGNGNLKLQISTPAPSAANYSVGIYWAGGAYQNNNASDGTNYSHVPTYNWNRNVNSNQIQLYIPRYADSSNNMKIAYCYGYFRGSGNDAVVFNTNFGREISTAVSAIKFEQSGGNFLTGTVKIYGVN